MAERVQDLESASVRSDAMARAYQEALASNDRNLEAGARDEQHAREQIIEWKIKLQQASMRVRESLADRKEIVRAFDELYEERSVVDHSVGDLQQKVVRRSTTPPDMMTHISTSGIAPYSMLPESAGIVGHPVQDDQTFATTSLERQGVIEIVPRKSAPALIFAKAEEIISKLDIQQPRWRKFATMAGCLRQLLLTRGFSEGHPDDGAFAGCRLCVNAKAVCLRLVGEHLNGILHLPLPRSMREGKTIADEGYWVWQTTLRPHAKYWAATEQ